jgi:transposase InsO family protein
MIAKAYSQRDTSAQLDFMYNLMITRGFGAPKVIITDRASSFVSSHEFKKFLEVHHIQSRHTSSYHPQSNGRVERLNALISPMLAKFCAGDLEKWDQFVDAVCFNLNYRTHTVTKHAPYYLAFGVLPRLPGNLTSSSVYDFSKTAERESYQHRELELLGQSRAAAFFRSQQQAKRMAETYDNSHAIRGSKFKVGDIVKRKMQRLPGMMIAKLKPKWEGPFEIGAVGAHDCYYLKRNGVF